MIQEVLKIINQMEAMALVEGINACDSALAGQCQIYRWGKGNVQLDIQQKGSVVFHANQVIGELSTTELQLVLQENLKALEY